MRIVAVSDSHGREQQLLDIVRLALAGGRIDVFVHCGDGACDMEAVAPLLYTANEHTRVYQVAGNWDFTEVGLPQMQEFTCDGVKMLAVHGDKQYVKRGLDDLVATAQRRKAAVAFYGHDHRPHLEAVGGVYLINAGDVRDSLPGSVAYAQVVVGGGNPLRADLVFWPR